MELDLCMVNFWSKRKFYLSVSSEINSLENRKHELKEVLLTVLGVGVGVDLMRQLGK